MNTTALKTLSLTLALSGASIAFAGHHEVAVKGVDQDVSHGYVSANMVKSDANGWLVVHRTDSSMKPGPVVGYAPVIKGTNNNVNAILQEPVASGDMLMLMLHGEAGGMHTGVFEYTLGATADGPIRMNGELVMSVITAK
ncbi:hypothetical protein MAQ5080_02299 [Marinomonas aquimarina]|uniref:DUF7282 domain-containing protein n=1 Tax=Marinomonas aquimarina TaxID=295068 RepID=A0A1A8TJA8_9GAMM|nr:hypothetical protein [Marinomonas aquimarina]SBS32598.1 hypothetical protein MAQ5080_02299 [Marinomonas aquimarina]